MARRVLNGNYRRLAAAILRRAVLDAERDDGAEARAWLVGEVSFAGMLLDGLEISRDVVREWVRELPQVQNLDS